MNHNLFAKGFYILAILFVGAAIINAFLGNDQFATLYLCGSILFTLLTMFEMALAWKEDKKEAEEK